MSAFAEFVFGIGSMIRQVGAAMREWGWRQWLLSPFAGLMLALLVLNTLVAVAAGWVIDACMQVELSLGILTRTILWGSSRE